MPSQLVDHENGYSRATDEGRHPALSEPPPRSDILLCAWRDLDLDDYRRLGAFPAQQQHVLELCVRHALGSFSHLSLFTAGRTTNSSRFPSGLAGT